MSRAGRLFAKHMAAIRKRAAQRGIPASVEVISKLRTPRAYRLAPLGRLAPHFVDPALLQLLRCEFFEDLSNWILDQRNFNEAGFLESQRNTLSKYAMGGKASAESRQYRAAFTSALILKAERELIKQGIPKPRNKQIANYYNNCAALLFKTKKKTDPRRCVTDEYVRKERARSRREEKRP